MEKLIHERLRESLGKLDDCCNISSEIINHLRSDLGLTEDQKSYANDLRNIINYIADQVEKYYIPRPRFEDGEPVQFGDVVRTEFGNVECVAIEYNEYDAWVKDGTDNDWNSSIAADMLAKSHRLQKVLDADGVEIKVGDTVWDLCNGEKLTVVEFANREHGLIQCSHADDGDCDDFDAYRLTHREPDSLKKLRADATKPSRQYYADFIGNDGWLKDDEEINSAVHKHIIDRAVAIMERDI